MRVSEAASQRLRARPWRIGIRELSLAALLLACGDGTEATSDTNAAQPADDSDLLYDPERRLEIAIEMAPGDWEALREEGFSLFEFQRGEAGDFDYTFFDASVSIDGTRVDRSEERRVGKEGRARRGPDQ